MTGVRITDLTSAVSLDGTEVTEIVQSGVSKQATMRQVANYTTNQQAINAVLTGYISGAGTVSASDTILTAIQKLNGNIGLKANIASPIFTNSVGIGATPTSVLTTYNPSNVVAYTLANFKSEAAVTGLSTTYVDFEKGTGYGGSIGGFLSQGVASGLVLSTLNAGVRSDSVWLTNDGGVGLGAIPIAKLHVERNIAAESGIFVNNSNASGYVAVRFGNSDRGTNGDHLIYGSSNLGIRSKTGTNVTIEPAGTTKMTISASGVVGSIEGIFRSGNTGSSYNSAPSGNYGVFIQADNSGLGHIDAYNPVGGSSLAFGINSGSGAIVEAARFTSSGYFNIGALANYPLYIYKSASYNNTMFCLNNSGGSKSRIAFQDISTTYNPDIGSDGNDLIVNINGAEKMRFGSSNNFHRQNTIIGSIGNPTTLLTINANNTQAPSIVTGSGLQIVGADNLNVQSEIVSFNATPGYVTRRAGGTNAAPSAILNGVSIGFYNVRAYGATGWIAGSVGSINWTATENYTDTAQGNKFNIETIAIGSTSRLVRASFDENGMTLPDNHNILTNTTTGTKIGTTTTQKLAFWGKTPVVQQAAIPNTSGAILGVLETEVNKIKDAIRTIGLIA